MKELCKLAAVLMLVVMTTSTLIMACDDDDKVTTEATQESTGGVTSESVPSVTDEHTSPPIDTVPTLAPSSPPAAGPKWQYDVTADDAAETWTYQVTGTEGDTFVAEVAFDPNPLRTALGGTALEFTARTEWFNNTTLDPMKRSMDTVAMGAIELVTNMVYEYPTHDHGAPLAVGKVWSFDRTIVLVPPLTADTTTTFNAEVMGTESVTVPAGTFDCFKLEVRDTATGNLQYTEWWTADSSIPVAVKVVNADNREEEVFELTYYNPA